MSSRVRNERSVSNIIFSVTRERWWQEGRQVEKVRSVCLVRRGSQPSDGRVETSVLNPELQIDEV